MAKESVELISAIRQTAGLLQRSSDYQWGHMGSCNCGFLTRQITGRQKEVIHARALQGVGTWTEQLIDYCPTSGRPMDDLIDELVAFGFSTDDLKHLERLSDPEVLKVVPSDQAPLKHNVKADAITYLNAWAGLLEERWIAKFVFPEQAPHPLMHVSPPESALV